MAAQLQLPAKEVLERLFTYNTATGALIWRDRPDSSFATVGAAKIWRINFLGKAAGDVSPARGYSLVRLLGGRFKTHRVIWTMIYGDEPDGIDHINHDRGDNRLSTLRAVSQSENARNMPKARNNTSGVTGVFFHKRDKRWYSSIGVNGKLHHVGVFHNKRDAIAARNRANERHEFHANHGI